MASVIRVKRRRNEDPAEALLLSQKKSRLDSSATNGVDIDSVLEFAGTLSSKTEPVASHIKEAIKKKKLHKQLHPHSAEAKPTSDLINRVRAENTEISQRNRYHIICSKRAIDIDSLDTNNSPSIQKGLVLNSDADKEKDGVETKDSVDSEKGSCSSAAETKTCLLSNSSVPNDQSEHAPIPTSDKVSRTVTDTNTNSQGESEETSENVVCLLDVEHQGERGAQASTSGITVNNVPMVSKKSVIPVEEESDDYVYDLYFTHTQLSEQHLEAVLTVEAMCNELIHPDLRLSDDDEVGDLDEDSNDESNWRNDYPDEDPGFFENEGQDYDYEDDMVERNFGDDEGDALAYWMDTRCRIEVDCSDFTNDDEERSDDESSNDEYKEDSNY